MVACLCTKCKPFLFNFDMKRLNLRLEASVVELAGHFFQLKVKIYNYFYLYSLQLKVTPYMYGIYLTMQQLHNLRRNLKNLGLLSLVASKLEVIRFVSVFILCIRSQLSIS
jgi:hypothetical protein